MPTVVMEDTPKMYTNMGKVTKPPPTPMIAASTPTITPPAATIQPEISLPPGTRSSSKRIMGGTFRSWSLSARLVVPLEPPWASPEAAAAPLRERKKSNRE